MIEFRDIFIAATAIVNEMPVKTLNLKHFQRITEVGIV
jgi:tRNA(fMet)-specific endonuclease VapC